MQLYNLLFSALAAATLTSGAPLSGINSTTSATDYDTLGCPKNTTSSRDSPSRQRTAVIDFYGKLFNGQPALAFNTYAAKDFINHAPDVTGDGIPAAVKAVSGLLAQSKEELLNVFVGKNNNNVTFAHVYFKGSNAKGVGAIQEFWRLSGTCLVEHWNVAQSVTLTNTTNPKAFF